MDTFEQVCDLISKRFEISEVKLTKETTLEEIGADSIDLVDLVSELEEAFDVSVPDEEFENIKTIGDIVELIENLE
ncbi:MAG: acyl carrier protein [Acutalibacteraceae bacterium]